jgi:hypothetical protein
VADRDEFERFVAEHHDRLPPPTGCAASTGTRSRCGTSRDRPPVPAIIDDVRLRG